MARSKTTFSCSRTPEQIARALLDAQLFGDRRAGEMHGVHYKTLVNWRGGDDGPSDAVRAEMDRLRVEVRRGWIDEARDVRRAIVQRVLVLARTSKNLRATTDALRRLNEVVVAHEILNEPAGADADAQPDDPDQPADPGAVEGPGGAPGAE